MKVHIIQFLIIIILSIVVVLLEAVKLDRMLMLYRATTTYVLSRKLAILINGMERLDG